jgi:hypothetical protein
MQTFKFKSLKKISAIVVAAVSVVSYQSAQAAALSVTGHLNNVAVFDPTQNVSPNSFTLVGVGSLGNCATFFGFVFFRMKDDLHGQQMYAIALAAAASGSTVGVNVDDTYRDSSGFCYVTGLSFTGN